MNKQVAQIVIDRANGYCEKCGGVAAESMALHHRKLRSRGGLDTPANLIWVHHICHNLGTSSIHSQPALSEDKGWMVPSWKQPEECPIVKPDGTIVLLQNNGMEFILMEGD